MTELWPYKPAFVCKRRVALSVLFCARLQINAFQEVLIVLKGPLDVKSQTMRLI
jgi:hypothetical protein